MSRGVEYAGREMRIWAETAPCYSLYSCMVLLFIYFYCVRKVGGRIIAGRIIEGRIMGERKLVGRKIGRAHNRRAVKRVYLLYDP
jgi:hypothetical protein